MPRDDYVSSSSVPSGFFAQRRTEAILAAHAAYQRRSRAYRERDTNTTRRALRLARERYRDLLTRGDPT